MRWGSTRQNIKKWGVMIMYIGRYMYPDYLYMYEVVLVHVGGTKGKVGNVYPRVCVCDECRQSIPKVRYLMYLVSVRSRRLLPRAAAFRYPWGKVCVHMCTYSRYTCVGIWVFRYRYGYLDTGG